VISRNYNKYKQYKSGSLQDDCDVVVEQWGPGLERRGWSLGCGVVDWPGSQHHYLGGASSGFEAGDEVLVMFVNDMGIIDGGCAGIISSDVAHSSGGSRLVVILL
jgi:hypothetical protein